MKNITFGRKLFTISEIYQNIYKGLVSKKYMDIAQKEKLIDSKFQERLMLAVTEVNKCNMCSYTHTKLALELGMTSEEINNLLVGDLKDAPTDELNAIMFAQHYADSRGKPDDNTWNLIVKEYGKKKALGILGVIRMIMIGNSLGIPLGSLKERLKGNPDPRSNLGYEIAVLLLTIPMFILAIISKLLSADLKSSPI